MNRFLISRTGRTICSTWNIPESILWILAIQPASIRPVPFWIESMASFLAISPSPPTRLRTSFAPISKVAYVFGRHRRSRPTLLPSIEDKIVKFPDKERQQIFLEPEGISTEEIYVNGFSTCLPIDVQHDLVRTIIGCENAEILRPAYAVEYDFAFPTQLYPSLETKVC